MRLIKIIGPSIERQIHLHRLFVEQTLSLSAEQFLPFYYCNDPRNKITFLAVGFTQNPGDYYALDEIYRSENDVEKSLLNIDFKAKLEHVILSVNLHLVHRKLGKWDDYTILLKNMDYLADCLWFMDSYPRTIKPWDDVFTIAERMLRQMANPNICKMLDVQQDGEYMAAREYLLDDQALAEVYRDFKATVVTPSEASMELVLPSSTAKIPAYSSPLKQINSKPAETIIKSEPQQLVPSNPETIKQNRAPLLWVRGRQTFAKKGPGSYDVFNKKAKNGSKNSEKSTPNLSPRLKS